MDPATTSPDGAPIRQATARRSWRRGLLRFLAAVVAILVVGEVAARVFPARRAASKMLVEDEQLWLRPRPGWKQGVVQINEQGIRDDEPLLAKPAGEVRVVLLGDSLVMGYEHPLSEVFSERLEPLLGPGVRCVNLGVPGWGTRHERLYLERLMPVVQPDVVVLVISFATDLYDLSVSGEDVFESGRRRVKVGANNALEFMDLEPRRGLSKRVAEVSALWQRVRGVKEQLRAWRKGPRDVHVMGDEHQFEGDLMVLLQQRRGAATTSPLREAWGHFERELGLIRALADAAGAPLLVVGVPGMVEVNPRALEETIARAKLDRAELDLDQTQRLMKEVCGRAGVEWLDLKPTLAALENGGFIERSMHLSAQGHAAVAEVLRGPIGERVSARRAARQ